MWKNIEHGAEPRHDEEDNESTSIETIDNSVYFYTEVSKSSVYELNKELKKTANSLIATANLLGIEPPAIQLHINSPGGSLLDGFAAVDAIRNCKVPVHTIIEGSAASAATLMSVVGKQRTINKYGFILIHQLSSKMWGTFEEMKDDMKNAEVFMKAVNEIYVQNSKIPRNVLKEILKHDLYLDAATALKYGLVDKVGR